MLKWLVFSSLVISLGACSAHNKQALNEHPGQYCYQTTKILTQGDDVQSTGLTECTDKPRVEHFVKTQGPAGDCRISKRPFAVAGGTMKIGKTLLCPFEQPDGTVEWSVVNEKYAFPNFN